MVEEGAIFGSGGCTGTGNLGTGTVSETTLGAGASWGAIAVDCRVYYDGNLGRGGGGVSGVSTAFVSVMAWLISVLVCFIAFFISSPNDIEGKVGLGSAKR